MTFLTDCECKLCLDITVDFVRYFYLPLKRFDLLLHFLALSPRLQFMLTHFIMGADLIFKYFETRHFFLYDRAKKRQRMVEDTLR